MSDQELYHYGVKGMKWGIRRRQKIQSKASRQLKTRSRNANQRVKMASDALNSNDPEYIKSSVHPKDSKDLKTAKKALKAEMEYWTGVGERAVSKQKQLMSMNINTMSTKEYKQRVNGLLTDKQSKAERRKANEKRIMDEIYEHDKKVGGDFAKKFLETYDDIELWDLYSPEELKTW